ncbi:LIF receptor subunit alpha a [Lampris incognitus]|uniref:LIF receptor subunit alpha a n=1 Tax=Lampris incognitus TaxID=2546036 RepID=UPI0024B5759E|nr:LIF receptor subunit alpha a [Lampris incognitus]
MPCQSFTSCPSLNARPLRFLFVLLALSVIHTHGKDAPVVPQQVNLSPNMKTQQLSISWLSGAATTFDLWIQRTELSETIFDDTVTADQVNGRYQWNWTSAEPLECTSLSVQLRSRDGQTTSEWSETQILQGMDFPSNKGSYMYPVDSVVNVGTNTTFCCIVGERRLFGSIYYKVVLMNATRLSRRSYAITRVNQEPSGMTGTNVFCNDYQNTILTGVVVFVGYPPLPSNLVCETHDLKSAVCRWNAGRDTHLNGNQRRTNYTLNGRKCEVASQSLNWTVCSLDQWDGNWTLVAKNPLGTYSLTDSAELRHRVRPVAPISLVSISHAWNATVLWQWMYKSYDSLALICQVELTAYGQTTNRTFLGVGLHSAVLLGLHPDEVYSVRVCCGAQQNFGKWGNWSEAHTFRTRMDIPETLDMWVWMDGEDTGRVMWKPLTRKQSHGLITGYEVTLWSPEKNIQHNKILPPSNFTLPFNFSQDDYTSGVKIIASITARNGAGVSLPASVVIPLHMANIEPPFVSRAVFLDGGFPLSWQSNTNASCGYVVEWRDASCLQDCSVDWTKVPAENTTISLRSGNFEQGVRYTFTLYSCSSKAPELMHHWQGYMQEMVPSRSVPHLSTNQQDSDIQLSWDEIPLVNRRGFLLGYNIYRNNGSQLTLLANVSDPGSRSYTVRGLPLDSYKFTVKAYNSAGEDTGTTASITLKSVTDWLILEILASLGTMTCFLVFVTFICYKKRNWVKKAFYPDIPEPKLAGDWSRPQGTMDVKPSPHSMVRIVEEPEWDSSKEALVAIPEEEEDEEGQGIGDGPVDADEPMSLRYYNQVIDDRPIRPRFPDSSASSASSLDSARTDVTYTGIQTSGSSLTFQLQTQGSSGGQQPQTEPPVSFAGGEGSYRPQMQHGNVGHSPGPAQPQCFQEPQSTTGGSFSCYQPQCSWNLDSPVEAGGSGGRALSLGSPTSIASTQFLLPEGGTEDSGDGKGHGSSSATSWFHNLLTSTKP